MSRGRLHLSAAVWTNQPHLFSSTNILCLAFLALVIQQYQQSGLKCYALPTAAASSSRSTTVAAASSSRCTTVARVSPCCSGGAGIFKEGRLNAKTPAWYGYVWHSDDPAPLLQWVHPPSLPLFLIGRKKGLLVCTCCSGWET